MSILFPESVLLSNTKRVIRELLQGHECATKLRFLIQNPIGSDGSTLSAEELLSNVERSFTQTISVLTSSDAEVFDEVGQIVNYGENGSHVGANSCNDLRSEDSTESKKRSLTTTIKDRRGSYKRRRTAQTWTNISETIDDNHAWRKYGQKEILNSKFPRSYFRCSRKYDQDCQAMKQVQRIEEKPHMYHTTYIGFHTCKDTLMTPQMVTYSDTLDSFLVNSNSDSKVPNEKDAPFCSQIIKQEYPKEDIPNDLKDNLDPTLWSDLKDLELYKPAIVLSKDFGVFPSHFSTDFHFDESHLL
ncbi:PREDICTED: probable WRKY transcription factor 70 isoform X2 [Lupinus angustifolius]|uniref:probable WRKY transcription factor 70 isoform X2 n=1 Tax=Lupinus angustifolius TaxID=3871 RepID=UPI00092ED60B|nr:PREDICTED: probable WRKY transcription factor 70 isoform X2 [Lupinus angustifolius]